MDAVKLAASTVLTTIIDHSPKGRLLRGFYADIPLPLSDLVVQILLGSAHSCTSEGHYSSGEEVLRWREHYREFVLQKWGLCQFCRLSVEDEVHALLSCTGHIRLQDHFFMEVTSIIPTFHELHTSPCKRLWSVLYGRPTLDRSQGCWLRNFGVTVAGRANDFDHDSVAVKPHAT
ncbi:hypothetical protein EDD85DRAFT_337762 [Armillaria nabsnona]|nr:hypothetical protein EDD85DRAFT_337762 [Armillaria nabsnona]